MILRRLVWIATAVALGLAWGSASTSTGFVWLIGCAIGWLLVHFRFGFTGAFRRLITERDPRAIYPIAVLLVLLLLGTAILLALQEPLGLSLRLARAPLRLSLVFGAFLFGIGMQMAGRCGSGTLATAGQPGSGFVLTLTGLVLGVFTSSLHRPAVEQLTPGGLPPVVLTDSLPLWLAVVLQLALLLFLLLLLNLWCGWPLPLEAGDRPPQPWLNQLPAVLWIACALLLMLLASGEPWKVLWGLGVSGAHAAKGLGWDPLSSPFWAAPSRSALLTSPWNWIGQEAVVVDLAVIYGAVAAGAWECSSERSTAVNPSSTNQRIQPLRFAIGGLLMGYGGFLSYGCNISSFVGGVMSFSLHGWIWLLAALVGSWSWLLLQGKVQPKH